MDVLVTFANGRPDKHDLNVQELVKGRQWKLAHAAIDKRLKKNKTDQKLMVNKALVMVNMQEETRRSEGLALLSTVVHGDPPITDLDTLRTIEKATIHVVNLASEPSVSIMWERAAMACPTDENLHRLWFETKLRSLDYKAIQKAAMVSMKHFPKNRRHFFHAVLGAYFTAVEANSKVSEQEKQLFGTMAFKLLAKAAADTPLGEIPETPADPSARTIQKPAELEFLVGIYRGLGKHNEALEILNDSRFGPVSQKGRSWELVRDRLEILQFLGKWDELWSFCSDLLGNAVKDALGAPLPDTQRNLGHGKLALDWDVITPFVLASSKINDKPRFESTKESMRAVNAVDPQLAFSGFLELHVLNLENVALTNSHAVLLFLLDYAYNQASNPAAFLAIRRFVDVLTATEKEKLLDAFDSYEVTAQARHSRDSNMVNARDWILTAVNNRKLQYCFVISKSDHSNFRNMAVFMIECFELYMWAGNLFQDAENPLERQHGDDLAIVAAMCCLRMYQLGCKALLERSIVVLEHLLQSSPRNSDALVLIVRSYLYIGAWTKALEHYKKLDVKNIQLLSTPWILTTRVSSICATCPETNTDPSTPAGVIDDIIAGIELQGTKIRETFGGYLDNGSLRGLMDAVGSLNRVTFSAFRKTLLCELFSLGALGSVRLPVWATWDLIDEMDLDSNRETRETDIVPSYEAIGQTRLGSYVSTGTIPSTYWLHLQARIFMFHRLIINPKSITDPATSAKSLEVGRMLFQQQDQWSESLRNEDLTDDELRLWDTVTTAWNACDYAQRLSNGTKTKKADLEFWKDTFRTIINEAKEMIIPWLDEVSNKVCEERKIYVESIDAYPAPWLWFHRLSLLKENMRITIAFLNVLKRHNKDKKWNIGGNGWVDKEVEAIRLHVKVRWLAILEVLKEIRQNIQGPAGVKHYMAKLLEGDHISGASDEEDLIGGYLGSLIDEGFVRQVYTEQSKSVVHSLTALIDANKTWLDMRQ